MLRPQPSTRGFNYHESERPLEIQEYEPYLDVVWKGICFARRYWRYMIFVSIEDGDDLHCCLLQR